MKYLGLEILSRQDIDQRSERLLTHFNPHYFGRVKATSLVEIAKFLKERHNIEFNYEQNLGFNDQGARILGACNPSKRIILIDDALKDQVKQKNYKPDSKTTLLADKHYN